MTDDEEVARCTAHYPEAEITAAQFEQFIADLLATTKPYVEDFQVALLDKIEGTDGTYVFDVTIRFTLGGMNFLVIVEAKRHSYPIKRNLVQVLESKRCSVGAHKAVMISTAPYQRGALRFAKLHGIALATVTEGRFTFETKSAYDVPTLTREEAKQYFDLPEFVGHAYLAGETPDATEIVVLSTEYPEYVAELLLGVPSTSG